MGHEHPLSIDGTSLTLPALVDVARSTRAHVTIAPHAVAAMQKSRRWVERAVENERVVYGVTTGFGSLKNKVISPEHAVALQHNIVRSHATGVGEPLDNDVVRAVMLLRANSLVRGYSGVRVELVEKLLEFLNKGIIPYVPSQGSVGSSGDLAPLCHIALALIGEGECIEQGIRVPTKQVLHRHALDPVMLTAKEGLALSNGTSVQTAILALALHEAKLLTDLADAAAALSVEVLMGSCKPFCEPINLARGQSGQIACARNITAILEHSPIVASHADCDRVQDSYSLRCVPQVHGACRNTIEHVSKVVEQELNAVTDNPLIFADDDCAISGGNFHGEPIAQAADMLKIAMSEIANIAERRIAKMVDPATNEGLPAFLIDTREVGLHSGLMIPQYVAAALVSENKVLAHPASVDSIPTSANQEDHVSMGTIAARQAALVVENAKKVIAIEFLNNTQAYEFRKSLTLSNLTSALYTEVRKVVPPIDEDRAFYLDIENITSLIESGSLARLVYQAVPEWNKA